jgi:hypothetical protein
MSCGGISLLAVMAVWTWTTATTARKPRLLVLGFVLCTADG